MLAKFVATADRTVIVQPGIIPETAGPPSLCFFIDFVTTTATTMMMVVVVIIVVEMTMMIKVTVTTATTMMMTVMMMILMMMMRIRTTTQAQHAVFTYCRWFNIDFNADDGFRCSSTTKMTFIGFTTNDLLKREHNFIIEYRIQYFLRYNQLCFHYILKFYSI